MMKVFSQHNMMILDLILVSIFGLSMWHVPMGGLFPLSLVLLRIFTTFSLQDKRKSNWLPIALYTLWMMVITFADKGDLLYRLVGNPVFQMVKVFLSFGGCSELGLADDIWELNMIDSSLSGFVMVLTVALFIFYYLWLLLYPIIVYTNQWRKKEFCDIKMLNSKTSFVIGYIIIAFLLSFIGNSSPRLLAIGQYNVWLFLMAGLPYAMYIKEKRALSDICKTYLMIVAIFYCAYIFGKEMDFSSSMVGLIMLPTLFYYVICKSRSIEMQYKDCCILVIGSMAFMVAQYGCNLIRILLLLVSAIAFGYEAFNLIKRGQSKKFAITILTVIGFILPTLTIGYNQYTVLNARITQKYISYYYAHNGIYETYNPKSHCRGLRDRYGEIIPCQYERLYPLGDQSKPFVQVRQDKKWGVYDIEKNKLIVDPTFSHIEQYSENCFRLSTDDGYTCYLQLSPYYYSGREDKDLWRIVEYPHEDLMRERIEPVTMLLEESNVENRPQLNRIYNYIVSTYCDTEDAYNMPLSYWNWAKKCTKIIETVSRENNIFISDTTSMPEQAIKRIHEMLGINRAGNQPYMNCYSFVRGVTDLYLAIDKNQQLEKMDTLSWNNALEKEYELWLDFFLKSYELYSDVIYKDEGYSSLPLDLNYVLERNAEWRIGILKEILLLFSDDVPITYDESVVTDEDLKVFIRKMDDNGDDPCFADTLRIAMLKWLRHRDNMLINLPSQYRESFANQTKRIRSDLCSFLKSWSDDFEIHKEVWALRAQMAEDESDEILLNE